MLELETLGVLVEREERARIPPSLGRVSTGYGEGSKAPSVIVRLVNKGRSRREEPMGWPRTKGFPPKLLS